MRSGLTSIVLVLDRSGSMSTIAMATVEGVNGFISQQQKVPGEASFTLRQFDTEHDLVYTGPIANAPTLTLQTAGHGEHQFYPRNGTAYLDAIGQAIEGLGAEISVMAEHDRPSKVVVVIMTDGMENSSHRFTEPQIADMIKHQTDVYKWEFIYLGANQDAVASASRLHIPLRNSITYAANPIGARNVIAAMSVNLTEYRGGAVGMSMQGFDETDRDEAMRDTDTLPAAEIDHKTEVTTNR